MHISSNCCNVIAESLIITINAAESKRFYDHGQVILFALTLDCMVLLNVNWLYQICSINRPICFFSIDNSDSREALSASLREETEKKY